MVKANVLDLLLFWAQEVFLDAAALPRLTARKNHSFFKYTHFSERFFHYTA